MGISTTRNKTNSVIVFNIFALVLGCGIIRCHNSTPRKTTSSTFPANSCKNLSVAEMRSGFNKDPKYYLGSFGEGQCLEVSGQVQFIERNSESGLGNVNLDTVAADRWQGVSFVFGQDVVSDLDNVKVGQSITIRGQRGYGTFGDKFYIYFNNSSIVR